MAYSGAWVRQGQPYMRTPKVQLPVDEHMVPTDPEGTPTHEDTTHSPTLPPEYTNLPNLFTLEPGVQLDWTPVSHDSASPGLVGATTDAAVAIRGAVHGDDLGAAEARSWTPVKTRLGHLEIERYDTTTVNTVTPDTWETRFRTGFDGVDDPGARRGRRAGRWHDQPVAMGYYDATPGPLVMQHPATPKELPPREGNSFTPSSPTYDPTSTPDVWQDAEPREAPGPAYAVAAD